ncbi:carboxymethylenebutenolidase [Aureobasidium pullulans]|uniref:Carboxymethylenebutenolidase n=1 Tax=Aureobasidium pullulans TaxID=5580 RepID=A0A4S9VJS6_AURPU|nr:carboxymethylenebutenolidase [Aureobasidium pullulans]
MTEDQTWNKLRHGFLTFNSMPPRVHVLCDDTEFDRVFLKHLRQEGFDVNYLPFTGDVKGFKWTIQHLADDLELGQSYAIIAFGEAATHLLSIAQKPLPHCIALIVYYPTALPSPNHKYPVHLSLLCHLASNQPFGASSFKSYVYPDTYPGFAERDLEEYDRVAADLSWGRTIGCLRKGFGVEVDLEGVVEEYSRCKFEDKDARGTMSVLSQVPYVNHVPTATGGIGRDDLDRFYRQVFLPGNPPSLKVRLLSRTIGVDKVVDEMMVSFRHTQVISWILPEVPPTNKSVQIPVVSIVSIRGGKLWHEQLYWDQASVLVQIGLLDPRLVPGDMRKQGLERLPVIGKEAAEKVLDEGSHPSNELISSWAEE